MKFGLLTASLALVIGTAAACGGPAGADAPEDAATADFCEVIKNVDFGSSADEFAEELAEVGTPEGIPAEAREGFEIMIDNASADEISDGDQKKVDALLDYFSETCVAG